MKKSLTIGLLFLQFLVTGIYGQSYTGNIELYISAYIDNLPGSNENDYTKPGTTDLDIWQELLTHLVNDELADAREKAESVNYQIIEFEDNSVSPTASYYVVEEKNPRIYFWGIYIINRTPHRSQLIIQSPHPVYDTNTGYQGIFCFKRLGALAFFMSGTHRCNHNSFSTCSGTTSACSSSSTAYRISDNAHNTESIFQKSTEVLYNEFDNTVFVQLHGFAKQPDDPYVIMSNGTRITPDPDYISVLRDELFVIDNTLTFKIPHIDLSWSRLIAFTNVQGRYINNSTNPCTMNATQCTGQFIHIEQEKSKLRQDFIGWLKMYEALSNTFPENPVSTGDFVEIKKESILIYPNPSQEFLYIKASNPLTVSIFNAIGQCIFHESYTTDQVEIDLVRHLPGLYHVRIIDSEGVTTQKLLLK